MKPKQIKSKITRDAGCCGSSKKPVARLGDLTEELRSRSMKLTAPRKAVLEALRKQEQPSTIREIVDAIPTGQCDRATVYRAMQALENSGLAHRMEFGDGVARFELSVGEEVTHHHHLVCNSCHTITPVQECAAAELEAKIATLSGFKNVTHKLEFFGICPDCAKEEEES
jgi:Fur family transcriptional regulator, ferric uptake regulator